MSFNIYSPEQPKPLKTYQPNKLINAPALYRPSPALVDAINVALTTGLPLLLTGEPGTGKTQLAFHLAHHFGLEKPLVYQIRTTSNATDIFYKYDSLRHFQYIQNHKEELTDEEVEKRFIRYNALGKAILSNETKIVLLDEIDKAPRDFPNDILMAIENLEFEVPEINKVEYNSIKASPENRPVIIMTSNSEKNLPDAFLRRCVYFHIAFPDAEELVKILQPKVSEMTAEELQIITEHFEKVRNITRHKKPSTAELIYWTLLLEKLEFPIIKLKNGNLEEKERQQLVSSYTLLAKTQEDLSLLEQQL